MRLPARRNGPVSSGLRVACGLLFPALVLSYAGCGGGEAAPEGIGSRKNVGKGKVGKAGAGSGNGAAGSLGPDGEFEIEQQEPDTCSHDACDAGLPLPLACSSCVATVCGNLPACCEEHWDDACTHLARGVSSCACDAGGIGTEAGGSSSSGKGGSGTSSGGASSSSKGGSTATGGSATSSGGSSTASGGSSSSGPSCSHTPCEAGGALKTKCSLCAAQVCAQKASCCTDSWGADCLALAGTTPGCSCANGTGGTAGSSTGAGGATTGRGGTGGRAGSGTGSGATGSGSGTGSGATGSGSGTGSGATGSGSGTGSGATGSGSGTGSGATGSGSGTGSGATGSGSGTGSGATGSGSGTGSGATGSGSGTGSGSTSGGGSTGSSKGGNGGQAGFLVGGAGGGAAAGCHSPCEEGTALAKSCGLFPFGICLFDPFCCDGTNGSWNAACVGYATKLFLCPKDDARENDATCDHGTCEVGKPLKADCNACTAKVCAKDAYCCETAWDGLCTGKTSDLCGIKCDQQQTGTCAHSSCTTGGPLKPECDPCVKSLCESDAHCCKEAWDALCVSEATDFCECGKTCGHDPCTAGDPLKKSCSPTTQDVCAEDPYCCGGFWDILCVNRAAGKGACGDKCSHDPCKKGTALQPDCGECEKKVCTKDPTCCDFTHGWDIVCVDEVSTLCSKKCE